MADELKTARLQIVMAPSDVESIDEWRRLQPDLPNRSEAIRRLLVLGMQEWHSQQTPKKD